MKEDQAPEASSEGMSMFEKAMAYLVPQKE